jgi:hypothetical protein
MVYVANTTLELASLPSLSQSASCAAPSQRTCSLFTVGPISTVAGVRRYSEGFKAHYVLPMCAAVWSVPAAQSLAFPVVMLVRFWVNHHLLDILQRPLWRVVKDRSESYVRRVLASLPDVRTGTPVTSVTATAGSDKGALPPCV